MQQLTAGEAVTARNYDRRNGRVEWLHSQQPTTESQPAIDDAAAAAAADDDDDDDGITVSSSKPTDANAATSDLQGDGAAANGTVDRDLVCI